MRKVKVHAGDFPSITMEFNGKSFSFYEKGWTNTFLPAKEIESLEIATEDKVKKIGGTLTGGLVGGVLLGPLGLVGGALLGGNKKEITFIAIFKDGKKMLATTDSKTFTQIQAASF